VSALTKADLRYSIKQVEKALRALDRAQECLGDNSLASRLDGPGNALWDWTGDAIVLRDRLPGAAGE